MTLQHLTLPDYTLFDEPKLYFGAASNQAEFDPRRGLIENGPFDVNIGLVDKATPITVGVVSTSRGIGQLLSHLRNLNIPMNMRDRDRAGTNYPGFLHAYRRALRIPDTINSDLVR